MAMTEDQYQARIAYLKGQVAPVAFPKDVYDKIRWLVAQAVEHFDDIDPVIFDIEEDRVQAIHKTLAAATPGGAAQEVTLSLLDMFDLERLSLLAERDVSEFTGGKPAPWNKQEIAALTAALENLRKSFFPPPGQGAQHG